MKDGRYPSTNQCEWWASSLLGSHRTPDWAEKSFLINSLSGRTLPIVELNQWMSSAVEEDTELSQCQIQINHDTCSLRRVKITHDVPNALAGRCERNDGNIKVLCWMSARNYKVYFFRSERISTWSRIETLTNSYFRQLFHYRLEGCDSYFSWNDKLQ